MSDGGPRVTLRLGDCRALMARLEEGSVDAIVTDPPYETDFMGRDWDRSGVAFDPATWAACLRVLKPGGHMLAFGGARTSHRMVCAIEDAGFEVRDSLMWLYGTGFPKSLDIGKAIDQAAGAVREVLHVVDRTGKEEGTYGAFAGPSPVSAPASDAAKRWDGWGTGLKPSHEPIALARKPFRGTVAGCVQANGTGALHIDACRVEGAKPELAPIESSPRGTILRTKSRSANGKVSDEGRWPANLILSHADGCTPTGTHRVKANGHVTAEAGPPTDQVFGERVRVPWTAHGDADGTEEVETWACVAGCAVAELDRQSGTIKASGIGRTHQGATGDGGIWSPSSGHPAGDLYHDVGGASRFFYVAKPSRRERDIGCGALPARTGGELTGRQDGSAGLESPRAGTGRGGGGRNTHPTVKPLTLCRYLVRLITPPDGLVLDPFMGSGTTGLACIDEGFRFLGMELDPEGMAVARARITEYARRKAD